MGIVHRQSLINTIISYSGIIIGYFNVAYLFPRFFEPEHLGLRSVLFEFSLILAQVSAIGFTGVTNKYFPYFNSKGNKELGFLPFILLVPSVAFIFIAILLFLFRKPLFTSFQDSAPLLSDYYFLIFPIAFFLILSSILEIYTAFYNPVAGNFFRDVFLRLLTTLAIFLYVLKIITLNQFWWVFAGTFALSFFGLLFYLIRIKEFSFKPDFKFLKKNLAKEIFTFGLYGMITTAASMVVVKIDIVMVVYLLKQGFAGLTLLDLSGIYALSIYIAAVIEIPKRALVQITNPILATAFKENNMNLVEDLYHKTAINQLIIGGFIFLCIWLNIDSIFDLVPKGDVFEKGKYAVFFLGLAKIIDMGTGINGEIINYSRFFKYGFAFVLTLAISGILFNLIFIPQYGITGAAIATTASYFFYNILKFLFLWIKMRIQPFSIKYFSVIGLFMTTWLIFAFIPVNYHPVISILIRGAGIFAAFIIPVLIFRLSPDLNQLLKRFTGINI